MVSEDFSQFIMNKPGAFFFLGNGPNFGMLHNPSYNINDELIEIGTKVWVALIEDLLELKLD